MSLYDPETESQGAMSSVRRLRVDAKPARTGMRAGSASALDQVVRAEEKHTLTEAKKRGVAKVKKRQSGKTKLRVVPRDPRTSKSATASTGARASAYEAEKEKQRARTKGVDEALCKAQQALAVASQARWALLPIRCLALSNRLGEQCVTPGGRLGTDWTAGAHPHLHVRPYGSLPPVGDPTKSRVEDQGTASSGQLSQAQSALRAMAVRFAAPTTK